MKQEKTWISRALAEDVECSFCQAERGEHCWTHRGEKRGGFPHAARVKLAERTLLGRLDQSQ